MLIPRRTSRPARGGPCTVKIVPDCDHFYNGREDAIGDRFVVAQRRPALISGQAQGAASGKFVIDCAARVHWNMLHSRYPDDSVL